VVKPLSKKKESFSKLLGFIKKKKRGKRVDSFVRRGPSFFVTRRNVLFSVHFDTEGGGKDFL